MATPTRCADVNFDMRDAHYGEPAYDGEVGDLLWNPKAGDGHVLVAEVPCGGEFKGRSVDCGCGGWGVVPCPSTTVVCECGEDGSWRDHHYEILARAAR
jgi:hypothetical protein